MSNFIAMIRGIPHIPTVVEVNVRSGPNTSYDLVFKSPVGTAGLPILEVQPDDQQAAKSGKVYQWFKIQFPNGRQGWVRDDLLEVEGDGNAFGYGLQPVRRFAFELVRSPVQAAPEPPPSEMDDLIEDAIEDALQEALTDSELIRQMIDESVDDAVQKALTGQTPTPPQQPVQPQQPTETQPTPPQPSGARATVVVPNGANMRRGPGTNHTPPIRRVEFSTAGNIIETKPQDGGGDFLWVHVDFGTDRGWIREDLLRFEGDTESFGLGSADLYPAPMIAGRYVRGFKAENPGKHLGIDWGAAVGEPIHAGPNGGRVIKVFTCTKCTPAKPNFRSHGLPLSHLPSLQNPSWGFGYGHFVILRYLNSQLPTSTQQELANKGLRGAHVYALYGHLSGFSVAPGQEVAPGAAFCQNGDTGNSTAPHLHLELRASMNANDSNFAAMRPNLLDPAIMFSR